MIITTTETVPGKTIKEALGIARGSTIRAKHIGRDIMATLKQLVGGELTGYTQMMNEAREEALQRMIAHAVSLKADAVVNVRFMSADVAQGAAEMMVYGTAVKLKK
ncbi:MAG TPA: YbjQ family protein [Candidatus Nanoarchaeia archaeon]|nr:YbjQ family protein [Candidatus Nanoarchaeia archaeon]